MTYKISKSNKELIGEIDIVTSKSESNRALIIQALCEKPFSINNLSNSEDTRILKQSLKKIRSSENKKSVFIDINNCGTAMRFLTAFLSIQNGQYILTGSDRMKERPIGTLVDALAELGAEIIFIENPGFPPIQINGGILRKDEIDIRSNISSQYISALLMIAPALPNGLKIKLNEQVVSLPYIKMTLALMEHFGVEAKWEGREITVKPQKYESKAFNVNGDWSAASYWYSLAAFADNVNLKINGLQNNHLQGDEKIAEIYENFGVGTEYTKEGIVLTKKSSKTNEFSFDFTDNPDLAQTVGVTCAGLNIECRLDGLENLGIKETNRIEALCLELSKLGFETSNVDNKSIQIKPLEKLIFANEEISTYSDHRMALAFAPLALRFGEINIKNPEVVGKSYPDFWKQLKQLGFTINELS